ncbi:MULTISPECIES: hypothetical protein [Pasteurellaceae]|uniref:Phage-associated protein, BcepMu gp16 family n=1 Tax=Pasteurella atlantica TaxID=2827233 RepID=A0AAW8CQI0_9PAST|nr:hypothetical protein [Pasteurella atlantica]MBR0573370.1 hypothetical protein [Pasteurella atlantica]MDP8039822.1 hypothetical protein [Pasteurella atlantica]MDP8041839.1 hypothetical protein [Pasteurella atlantica]MDP8043906.1 hypothetical protein [Pasteurella atlantica]MDP8046091.1 hypothetical protein [Pasteurella atlantica]
MELTTDHKQKVLQAKKMILMQGLSIKEWEEQNGFDPRNVYALFQGRRSGQRGESLKIALKLGFYDE